MLLVRLAVEPSRAITREAHMEGADLGSNADAHLGLDVLRMAFSRCFAGRVANFIHFVIKPLILGAWDKGAAAGETEKRHRASGEPLGLSYELFHLAEDIQELRRRNTCQDRAGKT